MISIGPILKRALKVPMTFLEVLSFALIVKGEGMIVSISRPIVRAVLKGQTFKADPLLISSTKTLAPMHSMVILQGSSVSSSFRREIFIKKGKEGV